LLDPKFQPRPSHARRFTPLVEPIGLTCTLGQTLEVPSGKVPDGIG
jgi:hypothetical protein